MMENAVDNSLIFANARVKSLEQRLLSSERITRLVDAPTLADALRILQEVNYGNGVTPINPLDFDIVLRAEQKDVTEFIRSLLPKGYGIEALLIKNDYHNAKAFMKAKYCSIENVEELLLPEVLVSIEHFKDAIKEDNYEKLPHFMAKALQEVDLAFSEGGRNPQTIDVTLDKAYFEDAFSILTKARHCNKNCALWRYFVLLTDFTNISTFYRFKLCKLEFKSFSETFVKNGKLELSFFERLFDESVENIINVTHYNEYKTAFEKLQESEGSAIVAFEIYTDNALLDIFKQDKSNMFEASPICGYYLGKLQELKIARLILVCMKNNIEKSVIRDRLREVYA